MGSEQQASRELMARNWSFTYFEGLDRINAGLKELGMSPEQLLQLIDATNELKNADFRVAVLGLMELKKATGKTSTEAEAYVKGLDSQIASKEKQISDWTGRIEKAKGELESWKQQRNDERAKFAREQARNKLIMEEDKKNLDRELSLNNEVRENIEETIGLKVELKKINLDLPTFKSIVKETVLRAGISPHIAELIREAVKNLGSLDSAIAAREKEKEARKQAILILSRGEEEKSETLRGLNGQIFIRRQTITQQDEHIESNKKALEYWNERIEGNKWQYRLFETFISMLLTSPSADIPLASIGLQLQELRKKGWAHSTEGTAQERRAALIRIVMGEYLHSIHCKNCGASFIVNKASNAYNRWESSFHCPVCSFSSYTKPDETLFNLMVSPELTKKFQEARCLLDMMKGTDPEALVKKIKLLDSLPKEVHKALLEGRAIWVKVQDGTG